MCGKMMKMTGSWSSKATSSNMFIAALVVLLVTPGTTALGSSSGNTEAEEARWLVEQARWGTISHAASHGKVPGSPSGLEAYVVPYGQTTGRLFFYLMGDEAAAGKVSLTLSEASLDPTLFAQAACGNADPKDPEDPRCAKLTLAGKLQACGEDASCENMGKQALFAAHPAMKEWPESHNFRVYKMVLHDLSMIADYGGGGVISVSDYEDAAAKHHPVEGFGAGLAATTNTLSTRDAIFDMPDWDQKAERARWVVGLSLWTTVSTISVRLGNNHAWGNIRSVVDGTDLMRSSGLPVFYLPTPDPTNIDVGDNPTIALTFTEAALAERVDDDGKTCGGSDVGDPICAQVLLQGTAIPVKDKAMLKQAEKAFGVRHPLAPWLAEGGSHTGGGYYTMDLAEVTILDYYGGTTAVGVDEYLNVWADEKRSAESSYGEEASAAGYLSVFKTWWALIFAFFLGMAAHRCLPKDKKSYDQIQDFKAKGTTPV